MNGQRIARVAVVVSIGLAASAALRADDVRGADRLLCASVQATACLESGECTTDVPWKFHVPQFIEIDLAARKISTTKASGEDRTTPIAHVQRENGTIVIQGFQNDRAFSFFIEEETGFVSVAVATAGRTVGVFGACTPLPASR